MHVDTQSRTKPSAVVPRNANVCVCVRVCTWTTGTHGTHMHNAASPEVLEIVIRERFWPGRGACMCVCMCVFQRAHAVRNASWAAMVFRMDFLKHFGPPKSAPRGPRRHPRGPKSSQERPKSAQERPKRAPRAPKSGPRAAQEQPRAPKSSQERPKTAKKDTRAAKSDPRWA